jgi:hypothetical protein
MIGTLITIEHPHIVPSNHNAATTSAQDYPSRRITFCFRQDERYALGPAEQELHVLGAQLLHSDGIVVDSPVDHIRLLLLQEDHPRLDRVFNAESRDDTGAFLADTVAAVGGLPFCGWVPPSMRC